MLSYTARSLYFVSGRKIAMLNRTFLFCVNTACGVCGDLLFMCCGLAAQSSCCDYYDCFWRRTYDGVDTIF